MKVNMSVLDNEVFRSLREDAQLLYIYGTLKSENGQLKNVNEFGDYLMMDVYSAMKTLEMYELVTYHGEYDSMEIIKEPKLF